MLPRTDDHNQLRWAEAGWADMDEVTPGEVSRRLDRIERKIDSLRFVPRDVFDLRVKALEDDVAEARSAISELRERDQWRNRVIIGALLLPVLVALILAVVLNR